MEEVPITKIEVRSIEAKGELKTPREALFNDIDWCKWKLQNKGINCVKINYGDLNYKEIKISIKSSDCKSFAYINIDQSK